MIDEWVEDLKTGEAWRLDQDTSKPVYKSAAGALKFRDGIGTIYRYKFWPCCPKQAPKNEAPETGRQLSIFDFMGAEEPQEEKQQEAEPDPLDVKREMYQARGYRPRIAEALARRDLGLDNPDAFLLVKFNITGEDLNQ